MTAYCPACKKIHEFALGNRNSQLALIGVGCGTVLKMVQNA
jgi:hypothetical protein